MPVLLRQILFFSVLLCPGLVSAQLNINVEISGIDAELTDNVRAFLSIEQQKTHQLLTEGRLRRLNQKAPQEIREALKPFGYYQPEIKAELSRLSGTDWLARYQITAGPPLPITRFDFNILGDAESDAVFLSVRDKSPVRTGATLDQREYENLKSKLAKLAAERGYFDARFTQHHIEIDLNKYEAGISLSFDTGKRYNFGQINLKQDVLDAELLKRFIGFEEGQPYSLGKVIDFQQALNDSDYFSRVEVSNGQPDSNTMTVPINVRLEPRKRNRYTMGIGYGTDTGARGKLGWEVPRWNRQGHRFGTELKVSQLGYSFTAQYRIPVLDPRTDQIIYSAGVVNEETDTSKSTVRTVGASLNRNHGAWRESIALNYQQENFTVAGETGSSGLLMPGINWSRTWGKNVIYTLDGIRFDIGFRGASEKLLSDTDFSQMQGALKGITPLGRNNRLILRGALGTTWTNEFEQLPSSVRFFAGGAQSVRGYAYKSLGPVNENNEVIGGKHLMVGSIEYERRLDDRWGLALFYDGGNAINDFSEKLARGVGFGLRWKSPVGPVRIDLAQALNREGNPWRLHINIGPDL